jgi:hypothetical protein
MKQEYIITIRSKGAKKLEKDFEAAGTKADVLVAKAGALNTAFAQTAAATQANLAGIERYRKALLGLKAPGAIPYKLITTELQAATIQAKALKTALASPMPVNLGANAVKPRPQTPGRPRTVFTGMPSEQQQEKNLQRFNQGQQAAFNRALAFQQKSVALGTEQEDQVMSIGKGKRVIAAADKEIVRTGKIHSGIRRKLLEAEEDLFNLGKEQTKMDFKEYNAERNRIGQRISGLEREARIWTEKNDTAKKFAQNLRGGGGIHPIDSGIIEQQIKSENADTRKKSADSAGKAEDEYRKKKEKSNKAQKDAGKNQGFINSRFAKFSIIMSGIAATLFVWQTIVRVIGNVVRVGTDMEKSFVKIQHSIKLSTSELRRFKEEATKQQAQGENLVDFNDQVIELVKNGYSASKAIATVNRSLEAERAIMEGTFTQDLKEHGGAWRELAAQAFENATANGHLLDSMTKIVQWFTKNALKPDEFLNDAEFEKKRKEILEGQKSFYQKLRQPIQDFLEWQGKMERKLGIQDEMIFLFGGQKPQPVRDTGEANTTETQRYFDFDADEAVIDPMLQPALEKTMDNILQPAGAIGAASADIWEQWRGIKKEMDAVVLLAEEQKAQTKAAAKHMSIAHKLTGQRSDAQVEAARKNILLIMKTINDQKDEYTPAQKVAIFDILKKADAKAEVAPVMAIYQQAYTKLGEMDDIFYELRKQNIIDNEKENRLALGANAGTIPEDITKEDLYQNERKKMAGPLKVWQEYHTILGIMTESEMKERQTVIDHQ